MKDSYQENIQLSKLTVKKTSKIPSENGFRHSISLKRYTDDTWYMRGCSSLAIKKVQIKTTTSYYNTFVRTDKIKTGGNSKCW